MKKEVKQLMIYLPPEVHTAIKVYAAQQELTISELVTSLIKDFLKEKGE